MPRRDPARRPATGTPRAWAVYAQRGVGATGHDIAHPACGNGIAAMRGAEQRAGDGGIGVGVAALGDGLHKGVLDSGVWARWKKAFCRAITTQPCRRR